MLKKIFSKFIKEKISSEEIIHKLTDIHRNISNLHQLKEHYKIAVIDDQKFKQAELLKNNNFQILELGDIKSIQHIQNFPIIICDIQGVGTQFSPNKCGGAFLISEIRKNYPDKYIIAYSTHANDLSLQKHTKNADYFMPVPSSIEQWTEALDTALKNVSDPILRWKKIRTYLLENDIELYEIYKLEQAYIKYLLKPNSDTQDIERVAAGLEINSDIKDIIKQFTSSAVVEIAKTFLIS